MLPHYFQIYWGLAAALALYIYCKHLFKHFHWSFSLAVSYTLVQSICFSIWVEHAQPYAAFTNAALKIHHQETAIIILFAVFLMKKVIPKPEWLGWLCFANVIATIGFKFSPITTEQGWLIGLSVNPSMNAALTVITLPFLFFLPEYLIFWSIMAAFVLIFMSQSTTPVLALFASFLLPVFFRSNKKILVLSFLTALTCVSALLIPNFINTCDRVENWRLFGRYWLENYNWLIGSGNGSFYMLGPIIQRVNGLENFFWLWAHSDIFQTFLELGAIGLSLWGIAVSHILYRLRDNTPWFMAAFAWLVTAALYYPVHFPIHLWLGMMIANVAIKKEQC